ncbi:MAG: short-chain dehydrogenase/reductase [Acidimicrobiales bacterium]|nr:short-chain dehydrogenase/reductase [Acidimicrobiales bacterium]
MRQPLAVVTGARRGLGSALAHELAGRGYALAVCATTAPDFPGALCRAVDVANEAAVEQFATEAFSQFGRIDLWINNAGILGPVGLLGSTDSDAWSRCFEVNVLGTVNGSRAFLARRSTGGTLVNIASRAGVDGAPGLAAYSATKAGVIALTKSIAAEEHATALRALVVIPPSIDTDMQHTLLAQDESAFPGVVQSRARRDVGGILSATSAARAILDVVLNADSRGPVLDLTGDSGINADLGRHSQHAVVSEDAAVDPRSLVECPVCAGPLQPGWLVGGTGRWADETSKWNRFAIPILAGKFYQSATRCRRCEVIILGRSARFNRWR